MNKKPNTLVNAIPSRTPAPVQRITLRSPQSAPQHQAVVIDIRLQQLAQHFRYMFCGPLTRFNLQPQWLPSFVQLCVDIDAQLVCDKLGFHWVTLCTDANTLCWTWRLNGNTDACVGLIKDRVCDTFLLAHHKGDPNYVMREAIGERIKRAMHQSMLVGSIYERLNVTLKPLTGSAS